MLQSLEHSILQSKICFACYYLELTICMDYKVK
jgi:hypothetical protein